MANLIIKSSANDLVIQGSDESPAITVAAAGTTTFAENATLSGTANNLGTVATMTLPTASATAVYPVGHVVQTKTGVYASQTQMNYDTDTWNSAGLTVTIDPIYANSKILVSWTCNLFVNSDASNYGVGLRIGRTGPSTATVWTTNTIGVYEYAASYLSGNHQLVTTFAGSAIDLPASTATSSYKVLINDNACDYAEAQYAGTPTTLTLQEIKV